ncbi:MAG: PrsW family intramembrane metalloprotease [bacterium]|nr:PrsW family intramembrane metalloprotease [bacterium]
MSSTLIIAGIFSPALFWACYFYYKDRHQPEPLKCTGIAYILGFIAAGLCFWFYGLLPHIGIPADASVLMAQNGWLFLFYSVGIVGVVEELFKFLPFILVVLKFRDFDEKVDGIVYASIIALGFAGFENLDYLTQLEGFELVGRAIASPLTHTIFSSIWGYTVGVAFLTGKPLWKASLKGLLAAALVHGVFDFLTISPALRIISALIILVIWIWRIRVMEKLVEEHKKQGLIV